MTLVRSDGPRRRVFIRTYGCQMNVYDSDRMADVLRPLGYALATSPEQADLVVLNTCHIREHASEKVYSELGRMRDLKVERRAAGGDLTIAVAGCVAQAEGEEIAKRQPAVDIDRLGDRKKLAEFCFRQVSLGVQAANSGRYELLPRLA